MRMLKWMRGAIERRTLAALGGASATLIAGLIAHEAFAPSAMIPVPNDPPTYAYGATVKPDGTPVKIGDKITRKEARILLERQVNDVYRAGLQQCTVGIEMSEGEADSITDLAYNIGVKNVCGSTIVKRFRAKDYDAGCKAIYLFDRLHGRKCSLPHNRNRKDGCKGIMNRRDEQYQMCMRGK